MRTRGGHAAALAGIIALGTLLAGAAIAQPAPASLGGPEAAPVTFALIGDTPYGSEQRVRFPDLIAEVNRDPKVRMVLHAGDIKSGSERCDDALFADRRALYDQFGDPFVLTPGDNEWTDCHRNAAGSYLPPERLERLRQVFYPQPGWTIGTRLMPVRAQGSDPEHAAYVENVMFTASRVVFATVHVVGSRNDLEPWAQLPGGDRPAERLAEFQARESAALSWIDEAFDTAVRDRSSGVLLMLQAEPVAGEPGFAKVRDRIVHRAA
ncbi:MAG: metallophosphoesterase, partial [Actinobacteria bacterium]|nr:metallophosphoesterase [Actinomycetota bacterium]